SGLGSPAGVLFSWLLAWALGYSTARRRAEQRVAQRLLREQVLTEERTRMARELHDLVGHSVNVMLMQGGAARRAVDRQPARSRELLSTVEQVGREALGELDRTLGLLRQEGDQAPGLDHLPDLAARLAAAGLRVTLDIEGADRVPAAVGLSAYRIA